MFSFDKFPLLPDTFLLLILRFIHYSSYLLEVVVVAKETTWMFANDACAINVNRVIDKLARQIDLC